MVITKAVDFIIKNNTIEYATATAIEYEGTSGQILGNKIRYSGVQDLTQHRGIRVEGDGNLVDGNILQFVLTGIEQASGDSNVYTNNVVVQARTAGILVEDGSAILVSGNTISDCAGDAIAIVGGEVVVRGNVLTANTNDLCNEVGTNADVAGQGAATTDCIFYGCC
jgi:parallel beta-helix repeat protein